MSIPATESVTGSSFGLTPAPTGQASASEDKQMFLELLVAQLRYQDPLNPTDSGQFLAQSAQFTALEKMQDVADRTGELLSSQMAFGASGMVGKDVTWTTEDGATQSGTIDGVTFGAEGPVFDIGGTDVPIGRVTSVTAATSSSSSSAPATPTGGGGTTTTTESPASS